MTAGATAAAATTTTATKLSLRYGGRVIDCSVVFSRRKTMEIAVYPDGAVVLRAPAGAPAATVRQRLARRAGWVARQLRYFEQFRPRTPPRQYVNGESHLYLGRQYRLRAEKAGATPRKATRATSRDATRETSRGATSRETTRATQREATRETTRATPRVTLQNGYFNVRTAGEPTPEAVKRLMDDWYMQKAREHFAAGMARCLGRFAEDLASAGQTPPRLNIRQMRTRWGSLSKSGALTLNAELIKAPRECIDYVITHELCHIKHHNHSPAFYRHLQTKLPNWRPLKTKLETTVQIT